ncbi:hypothetical protein [Bythopirellula goksoeyrii]|uniref:Uncharacterized protein n=1 Tax=Bythopirellula goksoeyrii TaxID=1400387 RepID=A0A5B9QQB8_9BACT|nr:hypothetical protein [Bythopirellula goksoeyrii]QEG36153.1 hypothetical protein Pr1d_34620 [Bythopirellula goksoeyrii]
MRCQIVSLCLSLLFLFTPTFSAGAESEVLDRENQPRLELKSTNREWFVIVSSGITEKMRTQTKYQFFDLLKTTAGGDVVHLLEATPEHRHLATGVIPDRPKSSRLRSRELSRLSSTITSFFKQSSREILESDSKQLDLFRVGTTVDQLRKTEFPVCVICVGTPIYHDVSRHQGLSMLDGIVPTLATLRAGPLSHTSVFYQGVTKLPPHTQISILSEQKWGVDSIHEGEVTKYLRTFYWYHGNAMLQKITDSPSAAFDLQKPQPVKVGTKFYELLPGYDSRDSPSEFGIRRATVDSIQEEDSEHGPRVVIFGGTIAKPPALDGSNVDVSTIIKQCLHSTTETALCMRWKPDRDIRGTTDNDWYLIHPRHREVLCFKRKKTPFALLHNDMLMGATTAEGGFASNWEVVTVKNEALRELEVWINTYQGVGSIPCNIMFVGNGQRTPLTIDLPNAQGDRGANFKHRNHHASWLRVSLPPSWQAASTASPANAPTSAVPKSTSTSAIKRGPVAPGLFTIIGLPSLGRALKNPVSLLDDILTSTNFLIQIANNSFPKLSTTAFGGSGPARTRPRATKRSPPELSQKAVVIKPPASPQSKSILPAVPPPTVPASSRQAELPNSNSLPVPTAPLAETVARRSILVRNHALRHPAANEPIMPPVPRAPIETLLPGQCDPDDWDAMDWGWIDSYCY